MFKGDCLLMLKVSLKPLCPTSLTCTSTSASASITGRGGVKGHDGPDHETQLDAAKHSTSPARPVAG